MTPPDSAPSAPKLDIVMAIRVEGLTRNVVYLVVGPDFDKKSLRGPRFAECCDIEIAERIMRAMNALRGVSDPAAMLEELRKHLVVIQCYTIHSTMACACHGDFDNNCPRCNTDAALVLLPKK